MAFPDFEPTVPVFVRRQAERHGGRTMIVLGDRRVTYRDAEETSRRWAKGLLSAGAGKGTRVALLMQNGPDWVLAWLAAARIGAVVVPVNTFFQSRELGWVLRHVDAQVLLAQARYLGHDYVARLEECAPELRAADTVPLTRDGRAAVAQPHAALFVPSLPALRQVWIWGETDRPWARRAPDGLAALAAGHPQIDDAFLAEVEAEVRPADPMVIIYSSGSAGDPKGAIHTHGAVLRHAYNLLGFRSVGPDDRIYSPMPFFWVGGLVYTLLAGLHAGATVVCEEAFEPGRTLDTLERERVTVAIGWMHYAKAMAEHPTFAARDLSALRDGNLYQILPGALRPADPELRSNALGMTETCGPHTMDRMDVDLPESLRGSFGHAVPGVEHRVVDPATGAPVAPGEVGEICVRGYSLMQGLVKREREEVFDGDGFYHTGDAGRFDADGVLTFAGRLGELIKTGGANVTPREVEVALAAQPEVKEAYVVGLPDAARGQTVAAAVVLRAGHAVEPDELRVRLKRERAAYKVPRDVVLLGADELPMTVSGKIDKRRLETLLAARLARARRA